MQIAKTIIKKEFRMKKNMCWSSAPCIMHLSFFFCFATVRVSLRRIFRKCCFMSCSYSSRRATLRVVKKKCEELTRWKWPWCWERLKAGGKEGDKGWDGWMASLTWWILIWTCSRTWWWTRKSGVLQFMESQRVRHDWVTELNWLISVFCWNWLILVHESRLWASLPKTMTSCS